MLNYVRVEDSGVHEIVGYDYPNICYKVKGECGITHTIKSSNCRTDDYIENLCDRIIVLYDDNSFDVLGIDTLEFAIKMKSRKGSKIKDIYACILTKWGLDYVAFVNDNGELELL